MFGEALQNGVGIGLGNIPSLTSLPYGQQLRLAVTGLFSSGSQGYWFDNSNLSTIFRDAPGTIPSALEAPVWLQLDLSQGLVLGSELIATAADQNFTSDTGFWTKGTNWSIGGGAASCTGGGTATDLTKSTLLTVGNWYRITYTLVSRSAGSVTVVLGTNSNTQSLTVPGTYTCNAQCTGNATLKFYSAGTFAGSITGVSVRQIKGNHRSQSTSANRPTLSALYNQAIKTENAFAGGTWSKVGVVNTDPGVASPTGSLTGSLITASAGAGYHYTYQAITGAVAGASYTVSVSGKRGSARFLSFGDQGDAAGHMGCVDFDAGSITAYSAVSSSLVVQPNGWFRGTVTFTRTNGGSLYLTASPNTANSALGFYTAVGTESAYVWGFDIRPSDQATGLIPQYQRVDTVSAGGYDTVGFPTYDSENGSNSSMTTAGGGGGTTAFFWCAAVTIGKVGAAQTLYSDTGTNTGYRVRINASNQLELSAGNGTAYTTVATVATVNVGKTFVLTAWHDGVNLNVQINQGAVNSTAFATATAGTSGTTIGCDNGAATSFFQGRMLEIVHTVNSVPTAGQIAATQAYCNSIGKAY